MTLKYNLIAHRGYFNLEQGIPENSLRAFKRALEYNYIIELDIHKTKDNMLVVFHDNNLKRVCGINKLISNCSYKELQKLYLFNTTSKIPLLSDVLKLVSGKVPIIIEIKGNNKYGVIENILVNLLDNYEGYYAIQSFNPINLWWFKINRPKVTIGLIKFAKREKISLIKKIISSKFILKCDYYAVDIHFNLPSSSKKNKLIGWTVRNKEEYDNCKNKYYNLICENMNLYKVE